MLGPAALGKTMRFQLRTILLLTAWVAFLFASIRMWGIEDGSTFAWILIVAYCALLPGSRWLGIAAVTTAWAFTLTEPNNRHYWPPIEGGHCVLVCELFVIWLYLAFCALRSRKSPNVQLGLLAITALLSNWSGKFIIYVYMVASNLVHDGVHWG